MLVTVVVDANDKLFLVAFAIVECKNNDIWGRFMACIWTRVTQLSDLRVIYGRHLDTLTVMKNKGLGWGSGCAHHRFCICHIAINFHLRFPDKSMKMLLTGIIRATAT